MLGAAAQVHLSGHAAAWLALWDAERLLVLCNEVFRTDLDVAAAGNVAAAVGAVVAAVAATNTAGMRTRDSLAVSTGNRRDNSGRSRAPPSVGGAPLE